MSVKCVEPRWGCLAYANRVRVWITKAGMKMNSHLPECPVPEMQAEFGPMHPDDAESNCFCDRLRACEQRTLDAAREALIAEIPEESDYAPWENSIAAGWLRHSIKIIDSLRGEK